METFGHFLKSTGLLLLAGIVPSFCWAYGFFPPLSWSSFFLVIACFFGVLWGRSWAFAQTLKKVLLVQGEEWATLGDLQFEACSSYFPASSLEEFKAFLHPQSAHKLVPLLTRLIQDKTPFQLRVEAQHTKTIYKLRGAYLEGKAVLLLANITNSERLEHIQLENFHKMEDLVDKLRSTLDLAPLLIWHRDNQQHITYCNQAYAKAVQASPAKVCDETIELISLRAAKTLARKAYNTHEIQILESAGIAEGERRHFRIYEIPDPKQGGTFGIAYDITEITTVASEITKLTDAQRTVLSHLSTAIAVYDADATLQYYNQAYIKLYDFDEGFLKSKPRLEEVLEDLRHRRQLPECADFPAYKKCQVAQLREQLAPQEEMVHLPDERTLRVFTSPHPLGGLLFMVEDVTDYLALERTNKAQFDAYQTTLNNLSEGVVVFGSDGRLKIFNPSFVRLWKFRKDEITHGMHVSQIVEKIHKFFDYSDTAWEELKQKIVGNLSERVPSTGQLPRKDGSVINFGYVPLPGGDNLFSYTDATDTSRVSQAVEEKNQALKTADQLKTEFLANVSHELRSPLTTIIGFAEVLSRQYFGELNERQADYVKGLLGASKELMQLITDILDLASFEAGHLTLQLAPVDIPTLLKDVTARLKGAAEASKQQLVQTHTKGVGEWVVDQRRLTQVLVSLLTHAIKFTPPEGKITLEAKKSKDMLEISVTDTGFGFSLENQNDMFKHVEMQAGQPYKKPAPGLALVKNIIELHGGRVHIESTPGKGTCITCILPKLSTAPLIEANENKRVGNL